MIPPLPWMLTEGYVVDAKGNVVFAVCPAEVPRVPNEETARMIVEAVNQYKEKQGGSPRRVVA